MSEAVFPRLIEAAPVSPPVSPREPEPIDASAWLVALDRDDELVSSARRAGTGLALTLPFALAAGMRANELDEAILSGLSLPVGLAMIALVGVSASTLGISMASAPIAPAQAAAIASRGLFRAGVLLAGLAPVTALWVAGARPLEGLFASSVAVGVAGTWGIATIARGLVVATAEANGNWRGGALMVAVLFVLFAIVVGFRLWLAAADGLSAPLFGD